MSEPLTIDLTAGKIARLDPDAEDLRLAMVKELPDCPFCGASAIVSHSLNEHTTLVVSRVHCTGCHGSIHYCGKDRDTARQGAIAAWSRRYRGKR